LNSKNSKNRFIANEAVCAYGEDACCQVGSPSCSLMDSMMAFFIHPAPINDLFDGTHPASELMNT
jgi:hypothetical protein